MLTSKQRDLLDFIQKSAAKTGVPPSFDEMKQALDLRSKSGIHRMISALEERGFIRRLPHRARAVEIVKLPEALAEKGHGATPVTSFRAGDDRAAATRWRRPANALPVSAAVFELPIMGRIAAGTPIEAISEVSSHVAVPEHMIAADSMIGAGINDGDIVVIRQQGTAENGDVVVALVDGHEVTLKRYYRRNRMIALEAANPDYETGLFSEDRVKIQGRLVGLIRSY